MNHKGTKPGNMNFALIPLSWLYGTGGAVRRQYYRFFRKPQKLGRPTIKVGNIVAGGTGKTPFVIYLARLLKKRNLQPVVLTRGFGRASSGVLKIGDSSGSTSTVEESGDEPKLIADQARCPVYVCENRMEGATIALRDFPHATFLLDDAYQQLGIRADINFVLIDATNPFGNGRLLPAGTLREPIRQLSRADAIVITHADHPFDQDALMERLKKHNRAAPLFFAYHEVIGLQEVPGGEWHDARRFRGAKAVALSAIGNPSVFEHDLRHHQIQVLEHLALRDHFPYSQEMLDRALRRCQEVGADIIVTTEKDAVKMDSFQIPSGKIYALGIETRVDEQENFIEYLKMFLDL
ncbi:MAG TPA: tetraacyldisaccharide 4'-kinase [Acidobacteriota bacterium]